ncbi:CynX/NimT family MFS transporter [Staphylococcus capitis]|uniref:CynX/NimT family MFS transporter n=1 Tax=Staphylococcus capitis TaxID=29388 RepID=UPI001FAB066E|nr:MFS transporter [Staphylococcus capitis]
MPKQNLDRHINFLLLIGIMLVAANLRAPITSVGVALPSIKDTLHTTNSALSLMTVVPLIAFGVVSFFASKIGNTFGLERTIFGALIFIFIGILLRSIIGLSWLYIGTTLIGIGIAFGNVLAPAIVKTRFPFHIGIMTGLYTVVMNVVGSLSSSAISPLTSRYNYAIALGLMSIITLFTIIIWTFQLKQQPPKATNSAHSQINIWKSLLAWRVTIFMGAQSLIFYTIINWLPELLTDHGISIQTSGIYVSILQIAIIPLTFITPIVATKMKSQVPLTLLTSVLFMIGVLCLIFVDYKYVWLGIILIGVASGLAFGLANTLFVVRTESGQTAAKLSGMAQSIGYLLAAIGPFLFGIFHDITHNWTLSLSVLLVTSLLILLFGTKAGSQTTIEQTKAK